MSQRPSPLPFLGSTARTPFSISAWAYAAAAVAGAVAVFVTTLIPALIERTPLLLALVAVVLSAGRWGWRAGASAAVSAVAAIVLLMRQADGWLARGGSDLFPVLMFVAAAGAILAFARSREAADAQLNQIEALSRIIVDNGPVLIAGADAQGNTVIFNRACEQLTGYTSDEVIGAPFLQTFVPESWHGRVAARFRDEPIEKLAQPHENPWRTKSESERLIEWRCFRVLQHDGSPITLGVGQDVTDRHLAEERIRESIEREAAARDALASANASKEHFIATLAHELRTPLNAAMGWFHIFKTGEPAGAEVRAADSIDRNLHMMQTLIEDIVDFNRAEYGKLVLQKRPLEPASLVSDVVASTRSLADHKEIRLEADITPDLPPIAADPKRLRQVLLNVLSNALKFTPPGGEVRVAAYLDPERRIAISVTDNGQGIAPEHLPHMFEPLWQPGGGERKDGLGLGLALVKRLIHAHGGEVRIHSDGPNRGTEVTVTLPVDLADSEVAV